MKRSTRRALAMTQEGAGHPFRRSLPPHVFAAPPRPEANAEENQAAARQWRMNGGDWRGFLAAYSASFLAVFIFIA